MVRIGLVVVFIHVLGWLLMYVVLSVSINSVFFENKADMFRIERGNTDVGVKVKLYKESQIQLG